MSETHHARVALSVRSPEKVQSCADYLQSQGFQIISVGKRGVDFKGTIELYKSTFQVDVGMWGGRMSFKGDPVLAEPLAKNDVDLVYFPNPPDYHC